MKGMLKDTAILFAITLISGLILGAVYQLTKEPIAAQEEKAKTEARKEVFADAASFADTADFDPEAAQAVLDAGGFSSGCGIDECALALDDDGNGLGWVLTVTAHDGYAGDIQFTIGVQNDGTLNACRSFPFPRRPDLACGRRRCWLPQFSERKRSASYTRRAGRPRKMRSTPSAARPSPQRPWWTASTRDCIIFRRS